MTTLADLLDEIRSTGNENGPRPIGVLAGYVPPTQNAGPVRPDLLPPGGYLPIRDVRPQPYVDGDEWRPASLPPQTIAGFQNRLVAAGLLTGQYRLGVWDSPSRAAYRDLLEIANGMGVTDGAALDRYQASVPALVEETPRAPLVARLSNPDDLRRELEEFFRDRLGSGKIEPARLDAMVKAWHDQEYRAQKAEYDAKASGEPATVVDPMSFEEFADREAEKTDPVAYNAYKILDAFSAVSDMLGGK